MPYSTAYREAQMPNVRFIADVHVGNHRQHGGPEVAGVNERCEEVLTALRAASALCAPDDTLVILGDLLDTTRPNPQILAATMAALPKTAKVLIMLGNHDRRSDAIGDHALGTLSYLSNVEVIEQPCIREAWIGGPHLMLIPYHPAQSAESITDAVQGLAHRMPANGALCLHAGLWDDKMAPWAKAARSAISHAAAAELADSVDARLVVSGDWHDHRVYEHFRVADGSVTKIVQCGALAPTGWDNPGMGGYGSVISWRGGLTNICRIEIPGPRFLKLDAAALEQRDLTASPHRIRVRVTALDAEEAAIAATHPLVAEVRRADVDPKAAAAQAARAARSSATVEAALAVYCRDMALPDHIDPSLVAATARTYLAGADDAC
jgi:calcineurin-like phosphoesterase family protein